MPIKFKPITDADFESLEEEMTYDPDTGEFWWVCQNKARNRNLDKPVGSPNGRGYLRIKYKGKSHSSHRLAFKFMGEPVPDCVDHINGVKGDNRWDNLRPADRRKNVVNSELRSDNTQKYRGIVNHKLCNGWTAQGSDENGKRVHLGVFTSKREAALAYNYHAEKVYGPFAKFNQVFDY